MRPEPPPIPLNLHWIRSHLWNIGVCARRKPSPIPTRFERELDGGGPFMKSLVVRHVNVRQFRDLGSDSPVGSARPGGNV